MTAVPFGARFSQPAGCGYVHPLHWQAAVSPARNRRTSHVKPRHTPPGLEAASGDRRAPGATHPSPSMRFYPTPLVRSTEGRESCFPISFRDDDLFADALIERFERTPNNARSCSAPSSTISNTTLIDRSRCYAFRTGSDRFPVDIARRTDLRLADPDAQGFRSLPQGPRETPSAWC